MLSIKVEGFLSKGVNYAVRMALRRAIVQRLRNEIQERVQRRGEGANGPVKGYSETPLLMKAENAGRVKPIILPSTNRGHENKTRRTPMRDSEGAKWVYYGRGYGQYKRETGQESELFTFTNKGNAWRDFKTLGIEVTADGVPDAAIGFTRPENNMAADKAVNDGRPDLFDAGEAEVAKAEGEALTIIYQALSQVGSL